MDNVKPDIAVAQEKRLLEQKAQMRRVRSKQEPPKVTTKHVEDDGWINITVRIKREEFEKLKALAQSKTDMSNGKYNYTPTECIRDFIKHCVTDGGGWVSPSVAASQFEAKKRLDRANKK